MRPYIYLVASVMVFAGCKKSSIGSDNGCISRITKQYVDAATSAAAAKVLKQNNISTNNLVFFRVTLDDTLTNVGGVTDIYQQIFALQYFNGLPVFSSDLSFFFKDDVYQDSSGMRYSSVGLNTSPVLTLPQVRKLFEDAASAYHGPVAGNINVKDSCLVAEFGYYNLNAGTGNATPNFVKAWSVTPKSANYPWGIFRDDNGKMIVYTSGIESNANL